MIQMTSHNLYRPQGVIQVISPRADTDLYHTPCTTRLPFVHVYRRNIKHLLQPTFLNLCIWKLHVLVNVLGQLILNTCTGYFQKLLVFSIYTLHSLQFCWKLSRFRISTVLYTDLLIFISRCTYASSIYDK